MCIEGALRAVDKPLLPLDDYSIYIGPPLIDTFLNYCGLPMDEAQKATEAYRKLYEAKGKYENSLYDGMEATLQALKKSGVRLAVTTSKYEPFAEEIVKMIGAYEYFDFICGSNKTDRKDKSDVILYALDKLKIAPSKDEVVLVGDSVFDTVGANKACCDFIGVSYGYGSVEDMKRHGCEKLAETPGKILDFIIK